ncbi:MAG: 6-phosphogluconate dehydrogenase [Candidatus Paceibacteria bacterium]|jgi:6-phosphogluconate dehydrogenase
MRLGYIGLGKMGFNMVDRMIQKGHNIVANNRSREAIDKIAEKGAEPAYDLNELVSKLEGQRIIWLMVPWKAVDGVLAELVPLLNKGDIVIDGGNSPYLETVRRAKELHDKDITFMDIGVSGGPGGALNGACMMVGGDKEVYEKFVPLLIDLCVPEGFGYMGGHGAGHYVKMVHNGIEYGMMQAIGEGFEVMKKAEEFEIDLLEVSKVYNHGSVIESSLVGWLQKAYEEQGEDLPKISGEVSHSGEGQWTVETAKRLGVPVENIEQSLQFRIDSEGNPSYTGQVVSALRNQFGGHDVGKK